MMPSAARPAQGGGLARRTAATLLGALCALSAASAADRDGRFAALGAGVATCERFLDARAARSSEYFMMGGWIDGYLSARNQTEDDTFTLAPWQSTDVLAGFLADYCHKHPQEALLRAVMVMAEALRPHRLTQSSERVAVTVGPFQQDFFREVLARMQQRLRDAGYYAGPTEGDFDEATARAVSAFQQDRDIDVSGFPDQKTLFLLFH